MRPSKGLVVKWRCTRYHEKQKSCYAKLVLRKDEVERRKNTIRYKVMRKDTK